MNLQELAPKIDGLFAEWDSIHSPGCALALIQDGEIVYQRGYGMASLEFGAAITPRTVFQIGSISKQFTAMAIAILAAEGKISLDDDVRKYVPEVPGFGKEITIRHLVHHTSGLRGIDELMAIAGNRLDDVALVGDYMEYLARQRALNFEPGEKHLYCNTGYTLMALIVESVNGQTMREFCDQRLFKPLGMKNTLFHDDYKMVVPRFAQSYAPSGPGRFQKEFLSHGLPGSTSLLTTVEDLLLWDREFYDGRVVGAPVIEMMHQRGTLNDGKEIDYAFGLAIGQYRGLKTVSHGGSDAGFRSMLLRFPEQRFSVIILSNLASFSPDSMARKVADLCLADIFTEELPVKETPQEVTLSEQELQAKAGLYYNPHSEVGTSYKFEMRDGRLVIALGPGFPLKPLSEDVFTVEGFEVFKMRFSTSANGDRSMALLLEGEEILYDCVQEAVLTQSDLQAYAGRYYSDELDTFYSIDMRDGGLWMKMKKHGEFPLQPTIQDGFSLDLSALVGAPYTLDLIFNRERESVAGLMVSSGRAKNLQFTRQ